jgi:hypothetical protein
MPIQVSYGHISRADVIREHAIALLQDELSEAFDNSTPSNPSNPCVPAVKTETDRFTWLKHLIALSSFVALGYALFVAVTR